MEAVMWDSEHWSYFDYNLTSGEKHIYSIADDDALPSELEGAPEGWQVHLTPAQFYPFWTGAAPNWLKENPSGIARAYERIYQQLDRFDGAIPASNVETGQQWDEPNVWPPLMYILIQGLLNTPPTYGQSDPSYQWTQKLALNLTQRYLDSAFCTWRVTGGSTSDFPQLEGLDEDAVGTIFEKYNSTTTNAAGGGGEYEVVEGFGWSNGVLIWAGDVFGQELQTPRCGNITAADVDPGSKTKRSAIMIHKRDAAWMKKMKRS